MALSYMELFPTTLPLADWAGGVVWNRDVADDNAWGSHFKGTPSQVKRFGDLNNDVLYSKSTEQGCDRWCK